MGSKAFLPVSLCMNNRFEVMTVLSQVCKQQTPWAAKMRMRGKLGLRLRLGGRSSGWWKAQPIRWSRIQELSLFSSLPSSVLLSPPFIPHSSAPYPATLVTLSFPPRFELVCFWVFQAKRRESSTYTVYTLCLSFRCVLAEP
jgi:hypothetical protein